MSDDLYTIEDLLDELDGTYFEGEPVTTGPEGSEDSALDDEDEAAFYQGEWTFVQVHLALVYCNEDGSEIELGEDYRSNTQWGTGANWHVRREELGAELLRGMKAAIWEHVGPMFQDIAHTAYVELNREDEAWTVQARNGYTPTKPADLMGGMQLGIYEEELAYATNMPANSTWYERVLASVDKATENPDGTWLIQLGVGLNQYFFDNVPGAHEFKVYKEG